MRKAIDEAIEAHVQWKLRLGLAIGSGNIDFVIDTVRRDDQCEFGKWIHGPTFTSAERSTEYYKSILELHRQFHIEAAKVAQLAIDRKQEAATREMNEGQYYLVSLQLTTILMKWRTVAK